MIMTRIVLAATLILMFTVTVFSQTPTNEDHDVIVLKNGGVARGRILTATAGGEHIILEVANGKTIEINMEDIDFITNNLAYDPPAWLMFGENKTNDNINNGIRLLSHLSVLSGEQSTNYSIDLQLGGYVAGNFIIATGARFDRYDFNVMSVMIHGYLFVTDQNTVTKTSSFFIHFGLGYGQVVSGIELGSSVDGANYSFGAGIMIPTESGPAIQIEIGLYHQSLKMGNFFETSGDFAQFSLGLCF